MNLKVELQKTKDVARVAREAAEAAMNTSCNHGVLDTETRLAKEVAIVCRDYCTELWGVAMDQARVPADSELRRAESIFFPKDIREILNTVHPTKQLPTTQAPPPDAEVSKGAGVDEEAQLPMKAKPSENALIIRDVVSQAKDAELKSQVGDSQSKKADPKKDPPTGEGLSIGFSFAAFYVYMSLFFL